MGLSSVFTRAGSFFVSFGLALLQSSFPVAFGFGFSEVEGLGWVESGASSILGFAVGAGFATVERLFIADAEDPFDFPVENA